VGGSLETEVRQLSVLDLAAASRFRFSCNWCEILNLSEAWALSLSHHYFNQIDEPWEPLQVVICHLNLGTVRYLETKALYARCRCVTKVVKHVGQLH
jgi:hypothetical protein